MADGMCSIDGCEKPIYYKTEGWCKAHYQRWKRHGDPHVVYLKRPEGPCKVEGCERRPYAHNLCERHYKRWKKYGDPTVIGKGGPKARPGGTCSIDGCDKPIYNRTNGWCQMHYVRWQRHGDPRMTHRERQEGPCVVDGCDKPSMARNLCSKHHKRWKKHGDPTRTVREIGICSVEGCDKPHQARGWCRMHYLRWYNHGDPMVTKVRRGGICAVEGCGQKRYSLDWCLTHYVRVRKHGDPHALKIYVALRKALGDIPTAEGACVLWTGNYDRQGYGEAHVVNGTKRAHRVVYEMEVGPIPKGMHLDHLCRVRACVNPSHLEPVTNAENQRRKTLAYWKTQAEGELTPQEWLAFWDQELQRSAL